MHYHKMRQLVLCGFQRAGISRPLAGHSGEHHLGAYIRGSVFEHREDWGSLSQVIPALNTKKGPASTKQATG
jgi:hypothetical protein